MEWWHWALSLWAATGLLLWRFPGLVHGQKRLRGSAKKWAIAHRGGSAEYPENTIEAFRNAVKLGCDMLEMDVQCTRDGQIVISHDDYLERITGRPIYISNCELAALPPYSPTFSSHFLSSPCSFPSKQYYLATPEAVFSEFPHVFMCIDIKNPTSYTIAATVELIRTYHRENRTVSGKQFVGHAGEAGQKAVKAAYPEGLTFMSGQRVMLLYVVYFLGLVGLFPIYEDVLCLPVMTQSFRRLKQREMSASAYFTLYVSPSNSLVTLFFHLTGPLNTHLQRRGLKVFYWVLNDVDEFDWALTVPCDGLMTDKPSLLVQYYEERGLK